MNFDYQKLTATMAFYSRTCEQRFGTQFFLPIAEPTLFLETENVLKKKSYTSQFTFRSRDKKLQTNHRYPLWKLSENSTEFLSYS